MTVCRFPRRHTSMLTAGVFSVARLYCTIVERALAGDDIGHGREGFYFGENGEHTMLDIAKTMGADLERMGLADTADPSTFNKTELDKYFGGVSVQRWHRTAACAHLELTGSIWDTVRQSGNERPLSR